MVDHVPVDQIEAIVGAKRHAVHHYGRAVSSEQRVCILHSVMCRRAYGHDLTLCAFSVALDAGISEDGWCEDETVKLGIDRAGLLRFEELE